MKSNEILETEVFLR